jgi:hypothetical protein
MATNKTTGRGYGKFLVALGRLILLGIIAATGFLTTGCASMNSVASADNNSTAPDPEWYQTNDNPFHAD